jgi:hypothetical protein
MFTVFENVQGAPWHKMQQVYQRLIHISFLL